MVLFSLAQALLLLLIPEVHAIYHANGTNSSSSSIEYSTLTSATLDSGSATKASTESLDLSSSNPETGYRIAEPSPPPPNISLTQSEAGSYNYTTTSPLPSLRVSNAFDSALGPSNGTVTSPPASPQGSYAANSSTNPSNYSITSSLPLYLTTYVGDDNKTVTQCPFTKYHNARQQRMRNETCCSYYNPSLDTLAFDSWISAGNADPSPSLGAKYGCCGRCTIRAQSIQVYYWPGGGELTRCNTGTTTFVLTYTENYTDTTKTTVTATLPATNMVDKAYGCDNNNSAAYVPFSTVIDGHTFTSPTPYIRFTSVRAYDYCGSFSDDLYTETDDFVNAVTAPMSTVLSVGPNGPVYAQLNWTEYAACTTDCNPIVSHQHIKYGNNRYGQRAYYLCGDVGYGYLDPPIALTKVDSLDDPVTMPPAAGATRAPIPVPTGKAGSGTNPEGDKGHGGNQNPSVVPANPPHSPSGAAKRPPAGQTPANEQAPTDQAQRPPPGQVPANEQAPTGQAQRPPPGQVSGYTPGVIPGYTPGIGQAPSNSPNGAQPRPTGAAAPAITIGSSTYKPNAASHYIIGSQTLIPGGPAITVSGTPISLASSASALVVHGQTQLLPTPAPSVPSTPITIGSQRLNTLPNGQQGYVIGSQTLLPGNAAIVVAGTTLSLDAAGTALVLDGTSTLALPLAPAPTSPPNVLTIGSHTLTANGAGQFIYGTQTLSPGGAPITVDGHVVSLAPGGSGSSAVVVVVDGKTLTAAGGGGPGTVPLGELIMLGLGGTGTASLTTEGPRSSGASSSKGTSPNTRARETGTGKSQPAEKIASSKTAGASTSTDAADADTTDGSKRNGGSRIESMGWTNVVMVMMMMIMGMGRLAGLVW